MKFVPHRKHTYRILRFIKGMAVLLYTQMIFVSHRKHSYAPPRTVTEIASHLFIKLDKEMSQCGTMFDKRKLLNKFT
jgi:hypothetical protein